ncbi:MAG: hypothetical protein ACRDD2_10550 [Sarcina sp.]
MPDYTGNLNLAKPIPNEDSADIRVINENMDKIDEWSTEINKKTKGATSEVAGIVKYGTDVSTALEGSKLAEILGIEYGGVLNNNNQKVAGKGYYDTANKKIYKCTTNTSINYADAGYFIEVSNNDLLGKLQNLISISTVGFWRVIRYPGGYKEFTTSTRQVKNDKDAIAFPENFTDLDSINIQLTEITNNEGVYTSVGIVGVGNIELDKFSIRLHRPGSVTQSPELMMIRAFGR